MKFSVTVTLKKDVLDPQGKVVGQTLKNMGIKNLNQVRQGKFFEIDMDEKDSVKAEGQVKEMCEKLLANQIIEDFKINFTDVCCFRNYTQSPSNLLICLDYIS